MNLFARFFGFIGNPSHNRTLGILAVLTIALSIPLTVKIAQQQQELRQQAAGNCNIMGAFCTDISNPSAGITCGPNTSGGGVCPDGSSAPFLCQQCTTTSAPTGVKCPSGQTPTCSQGGLNFFNDGTYICSNNVPPNCTPSAQQPQQPSSPASPPSAGAGDCRCRYIPATEDEICTDSQGRNCTPGAVTPPVATPAIPAPPAAATPAGKTCEIQTADANPNHQQNKETWGGSCTELLKSRAVNINGRSDCQFAARCETYKTGALCWKDFGTEYPANCSTTTPSSTPSSQQQPQAGGGTPSQQQQQQQSSSPSPTAAAGTPNCTNNCVAAANVCSSNAGVLNQRSDGSTSCTQVSCTLPNPVNNCPSPKVCNTSQQCVDAQAVAGSGGATIILSGLKLHGLGTAGDVRNIGSKTTNPKRKARSASLELIPSDGTTTVTANATLQDSDAGFTLTSALSTIAVKSYTVKIKVEGFLKKFYGSPVTINAGENKLSNSVSLIAGDLNNDNKINAQDYELLRPCYEQQGTGDCAKADLDDNLIVDIIDFNLFLREFGQNGE